MHIRFRTAVVAAIAALSLVACAAPQPLPVREVIDHAQSPDAVISAMRYAKTTYALRGSDFGTLQSQGVSDRVLDYLQQSFIDDVDLLTRYWVLGETVGGCARCLPVEVDLRDPTAPRERPTSTALRFDRPQGLPSWFHPYSVKRGHITVDRIREMAASGVPEAEIVRTIRETNLDAVVGVGPIAPIRTRPTAGVSGSQLANLHRAGVSDVVLDELQSAFLSQFVEVERLRYQLLGKGPGGGFN